MPDDRDTHDFQVTDIQLADEEGVDGAVLMLTDIRGGRVRLHLNSDMAELMRERVAAALDKRTGP